MCTSAMLLAILVAATGDVPSRQDLIVEDAQVKLIAEVHGPAKEAGILAELHVKEGDLVEANASLGQLDSDLAAIDTKLAQIEHEIAKLQSENDVDRRYAAKSLKVAQSELQRSQASAQAYPQSISQTELERLQLVVDKSDLSIEQAERDLQVAGMTKQLKDQAIRTAAKHIEQRQIVAPVGGMVVQVFRQPGEWLDAGDPVARIIKMDRLRVEAFVDGLKYGADLLGCPVQLTTHLPPGDRIATFAGEVVFVSPELQPVNGQMRIWAEVENRDLELRPGARGKLAIDLSKDSSSAIGPGLAKVRRE